MRPITSWVGASVSKGAHRTHQRLRPQVVVHQRRGQQRRHDHRYTDRAQPRDRLSERAHGNNRKTLTPIIIGRSVPTVSLVTTYVSASTAPRAPAPLRAAGPSCAAGPGPSSAGCRSSCATSGANDRRPHRWHRTAHGAATLGIAVRAAQMLEDAPTQEGAGANSRSATNGLARRSAPKVDIGPCPGTKRTSSPSGKSRSRIERMSAG